MMSKLFMLSVVLGVASLTGCGLTSESVEDHVFQTDLDGLQRIVFEDDLVLYTRPRVPQLSAYKRFIVDPVRIISDDPSIESLDPEDVARMQRYFRDAVTKQLRDGGYEVSDRVYPGTFRITLTISGLEAPTALLNATLALQPFVLSVGEVSIEGEFREAVSGRIDAAVVSRTAGPRMLNSSPWSSWADIEASFDNWAEGFREAVDEAHGR